MARSLRARLAARPALLFGGLTAGSFVCTLLCFVGLARVTAQPPPGGACADWPPCSCVWTDPNTSQCYRYTYTLMGGDVQTCAEPHNTSPVSCPSGFDSSCTPCSNYFLKAK